MARDGRAAACDTALDKRSGTRFLLALAAYFALQVVLRVSSPAMLDLDESEALLAAQRLQRGYGSQPPLYCWLQWLMFSVFGINVFALSLQKNLLLFCTYAAMFCTARPLLGVGGAMIAAASLILLPQIGWESQRDLTHSVLVTCMAALTLWCYFWLLRKPGRWRHALFGLLLGLGLQSKYNFVLFAAGLFAASLVVREHRQAFWSRHAPIALGVLLLAVAPHGLWLFEHLDLAASATQAKMAGHHAGYAANVAHGLASMAGASILFLSPLWIVYGWIWWRRRSSARLRVDSAQARFFIWFYLAAFACIAALVLGGVLASIKDRWMQPLLFLAPLAFFTVFPTLADRKVCRGMLWVAGVFAVLIVAGLSARAHLGQNTRAPYGELSSQLTLRFPQARILVAGEPTDAANLYLQNPAWTVMPLRALLQGRPAIDGDVLLIDPGNRPGKSLGRFLAAYRSAVVRQRGRIDAGKPGERLGTKALSYALVSVKEE